MADILWARFGDRGDYEAFGGVDEFASELVGWDDGLAGGRELDMVHAGVETPGFRGRNYVSLYWGDRAGEVLSELSSSEVSALRRAVDREVRESRFAKCSNTQGREMNKAKVARELVKLAKGLVARKTTYELWVGKRLVSQVRGPEGMTVRDVKKRAEREAYLLGELADKEGEIFRSTVYVRPVSRGPKVKLAKESDCCQSSH